MKPEEMRIPLSDVGRTQLLDACRVLDKASRRPIRMDCTVTSATRIRQDVKLALALLRAAQGWALADR